MATLEINGKRVQVDDSFLSLSPDQQQKTVEEIAASLGQVQSAPKSSILEQAGQGAKEGVGSFVGTPVDAAAGVINAMQSPVDVYLPLNEDMTVGKAEITPREKAIQNPFGGSRSVNDALSAAIPDAPPPDGAAQRYARRIGQEVGFGAPASLVGARLPGIGPSAQGNMPAYMAASTAGDISAGVGGQTAREIAPNSDAADLIASILAGGMGAAGVSMMMPKRAPVPSLDDVKRQANSAWDKVNNSDTALTAQGVQEYTDRLSRRLADERATDARLYPRANAAAESVADNTDKTLGGIISDRRFIGRTVAKNADEASAGVAMKKEIDDFLKSLDAQKASGSDVAGSVDDFNRANDLTSRVKRAEAVLNKEMRGDSRAATSGVGGNSVNAQRQNIRAIFDKERDPTLSGRRQGFTPDEMDQMSKVVFGTRASNAARMAGRLAPTSGALPMMAMGGGGVSGATAALMTGNPLYALPMGAAGVGLMAKGAAESMTKNQINDLIATILSGRAPQKSSAKAAAQAAIVEQLLSSGAN